MPKSIDLLDAISVTELVQLKDSNQVELNRLCKKLAETDNSEQTSVLAPFIGSRINLDTKLADIINARLLEALEPVTNTNKQDA